MSVPPFSPHNVQGDIVIGLTKTYEAFVFLHITSAPNFRKALGTKVHSHITSTEAVQGFKRHCSAIRQAEAKRVWIDHMMTNIAFSAHGLRTLGLPEADIPEGAKFRNGQPADAGDLGDPLVNGKPSTWESEYLQETVPIDALVLVTATKKAHVEFQVEKILEDLGGSATVVKKVMGYVRDEPQRGREHFGFQDGLTTPKINGFNAHPENAKAGNVPASVILTGHEAAALPPNLAWTKDGSFLAFRHLRQLVPEFNEFLKSAADPLLGTTPEFIGARMMGRWKSGAPIELAPLVDDEALAKDPVKRQDFDFSTDLGQIKCPYASHARKTNPRDGMGAHNPPASATLPHLIVRQGITYGPEVSEEEHKSGKSDPRNDRGLLFVSYQSRLESGFSFVQQFWCNNQRFPDPRGVNEAGVQAGFDLIVGQDGHADRVAQGIRDGAPTEQSNELRGVPAFVVPLGGEYFFSPSLDAIKNKLGTVA